MSEVSRTTAKGYFNTGDVPTETQFANLIDSVQWFDEADDVGVNTQTSSYVLVLADRGKSIRMNVGSANTVTVPPNSSVAYEIGTLITVRQHGAGTTTIVAGSGVTLNGNLQSAGQYTNLSLHKVGTNEWDVSGGVAVSGGDTTAPTVVSMTAIDDSTIRVVFSESVTVTVAGWSFDAGGALTIFTVGGSGNTWDFDISTTMNSGMTITGSYDSGAGNTVDAASNELASFTNSSVTNSISGGSYDTDAEAYFTAAGITDTTEKNHFNTLVLAIKAISSGAVWTNKIKMLRLLGGATASTQSYDLRNPTDVTTWEGGITHTQNKAQYNGSTGRGLSGFVPSVEIASKNDMFFGLIVSAGNTNGNTDMGCTQTGRAIDATIGAANMWTNLNDPTNTAHGSNHGGQVGVWLINRENNASTYKIYKNGTEVYSVNTTTSDLVEYQINFGSSSNGDSILYPSNATHSGYYAGETLTAAEAIALTDAIEAWATSRGVI